MKKNKKVNLDSVAGGFSQIVKKTTRQEGIIENLKQKYEFDNDKIDK